MNDTPETDATWDSDLRNKCQKLERERDRLAAAGKDLLKNLYSINDNSKIASIRWMKEALQSLKER